MLIKSITLENFKGIQEKTRIELKPITLLFGANSAGKSTILQALLYAREVLGRHNLDPDKTLLGGDVLDLGGFKNLVNQHDLSKDIVIGFELDIYGEDLPDYLSENERFTLESVIDFDTNHLWISEIECIAFRIRISWSDLLNKPIVKQAYFYINDSAKESLDDENVVLKLVSSNDGKSINIDSFNYTHPIFYPTSDNESELTNFWDELNRQEQMGFDVPTYDSPLLVFGLEDALPPANKALFLGFNSTQVELDNYLISLFSSMIVGPIDLVRNELEKLTYIGPLRDIPSRHFNYARSPDTSEWSNGAAAWNILNRECDSFIDEINHWLNGEEQLNSGYEVVVREYRELDTKHPISNSIRTLSLIDEDPDELLHQLEALPIKKQVTLNETASDLVVHPYDIGVGISQLLPVIVAVLYQRFGLIAIEQPELHIHPRLQVALGDLFASQVRNEDVKTIYLLETHSEHLILRLLNRIRQTTANELPPGKPSLAPEDVAVLYIESSSDGMKISNLEITDDGDFSDEWPSGFFEERDEELF